MTSLCICPSMVGETKKEKSPDELISFPTLYIERNLQYFIVVLYILCITLCGLQSWNLKVHIKEWKTILSLIVHIVQIKLCKWYQSIKQKPYPTATHITLVQRLT